MDKVVKRFWDHGCRMGMTEETKKGLLALLNDPQ